MTLSPADHLLLRLSVAICQGRWDLVRQVRRETPEPPDRTWREAVLQAHLFAGFPRVVEASRILRDEGGLGEPDPDECEPLPENFEAGREMFTAIYDVHAESVAAELVEYHPALAHWIGGHAYGRVLSRPGLSAARREVLSVACLAALGQSRQLASHARGAVLCGADPGDLREALTVVADLLEEKRIPEFHRILDQFAPV